MKNGTLVSRVEQVCCLGLDGQMFIPALLHELHACIPSNNNVFYWVDNHMRVVNVYSEAPPQILPRYLSEFLNKREREAFPGVSDFVAKYSGAFTVEEIVYDNFYRSAFYNEILRPAGYHHMAAVVIRDHSQRLGLLVSHRGAKDAAFQRKDKVLLEHLAPFIAHGMQNALPVEYPLIEHPECGLMILDRQKRVQHISRRARHLLFLCGHPQISADSVKGGGLTIPPELGFVIDRLKAIYNDSPAPAPPVWRCQNPWGSFIFRAHWLDAVKGPDGGAIGVNIHYREPFPLKVVRLARKLALTPKQVQVCALLAAGYSYEKIAQHQQVSTYTVTDHVRKLLTKFAVTNRSELITKLMSA